MPSYIISAYSLMASYYVQHRHRCVFKTPAKTEMDARWKGINIQRNQTCFGTFESNCNTEEQTADKQASLAVTVAITLKLIRKKNIYHLVHFLFFPFPTSNAIYPRRKRVIKRR